MDENIQARANKGIGVVTTIISLVQEISFGEHIFEMALLFRKSMLINSILSSCEVLYGVKNKHIQMLESCDRTFFSKLFRVPITCSNEAAFLETGCLPIRHILMGRRVMYLWTLLKKKDEELVNQVDEDLNKSSRG